MGSHEFMMMRGFVAFGLLCYILMFSASLDGTWYQSLSLRLINNSSSDVLPDHGTKSRHEVKNEEMDLDQEQRKGIRNCDDHCNFLRDSSLKFTYSTLIKSSDPYSTTNNFDSTSSLRHRFISPFHKSFYEGYIDDHNVQAVSGEDESSSLLWQSIDKLRGFLGLQVERKNLLEIPSIPEALHLSDSPAAAPSPLQEDSGEMKGNSRSPLPAATPQNIIKESPSPLQSPSGFVRMPPAVSKQDSGNTKAILKAVILTAVSTSLVAFMVFCCYQKCILNGSGWKTHKDERPLLSSSTHDTSLNRYYGEPISFNWGKTLTFNQASATSTSPDRVGTECSMSSSRKTRVLRVMSLPTDLRKGGDASNFHFSTQLSPKPHYQVELANISSLNSAKSSADDTGTPTLFSSASKAESSSSSSSNSFSAIGSQQSTNKPPPPPPPVPPAAAPTSNSLTAGKLNSNASSPPPPPPPPPNISRIPPPLPPRFKAGPTKAANNSTGNKMGETEAQQPKLKPFHWDKVSANADHSMVWDQLRAGSFQFNEEMITTLFGYNNATTEGVGGQKQTFIHPTETLHFLEQKKSQNLAIVLRALNVTKEEIRDALLQGEGLSTQVIEALVKMAPTKQEEKKLKDYQGDVSRLATAERFLKSFIDVPFVFERLEAILFKENFREEAINISESFKILEAACIELRSSRLFLKLLEAVLKTGNRMNVGTFRGGAQAFKLDTLLKLSDVKGTDRKTTLLHFVVQEIIRAEGIRAARSGQQSGSDSCSSFNNSPENGADGERTSCNEGHYRTLGLEVLANLSTDLHNVRTAAGIDSNTLTNSVLKLSQGLFRLNTVVQRVASVDNGDGTGIRSASEGKFCQCMMSFIKQAEEEVNQLQVEEKKITSSVRKITEYFHGDAAKEEAHPFRIFVIVRDFTGMLDKVCKEVGRALKQKLPPHNEPQNALDDKPANSPFPMKYGESYSSDDE